METLFKEDESCVEMIMSNTALGVIGGSVTGFVKSAYYMGPKIPVVPIKTPISTAQAARVIGNMGAQYGMLAAVFTGGMCFSRTIRHKDDAINWMIGGFMSGAMIGLKKKTFHHVVFTGCCMGLVSAGCYFFSDGLREDYYKNHQTQQVLEKNVKFYTKASHDENKKIHGTHY